MSAVICITAYLLMIPVIYSLLMFYYRDKFTEEKNRKKIPMSSFTDWLVVVTAQLVLLKFWYFNGQKGFEDISLLMILTIITALVFFCMSDVVERIIPNRILVIYLLLFVIIQGIGAMLNTEAVFGMLLNSLFGATFSLLVFGLAYIICHGNVGAGDVKLAVIMGLYLTQEYIAGAVLFGAVTASVYSVIQLIRKKITKKDAIPYAPFLYLGTIVCLAVR